jgi:hypothetical protein
MGQKGDGHGQEYLPFPNTPPTPSVKNGFLLDRGYGNRVY